MLRQKLRELVQLERRSNAEVIRALKEVQIKGLHLEWGFSSLFHYCVQELGYSNAAASRRVSTVYLALDLPEVTEEIATGALSLNRAQAISNFIRKEKEQAKVVYTCKEKTELLEAVKTCTQEQAERVFAQRTKIENPRFQEKQRVMANGEIHAHLKYSVTLKEKIKQVKDLMSTSHSNLTDS